MRVALFLVFLGLADAARSGPQMSGAKLKPEPPKESDEDEEKWSKKWSDALEPEDEPEEESDSDEPGPPLQRQNAFYNKEGLEASGDESEKESERPGLQRQNGFYNKDAQAIAGARAVSTIPEDEKTEDLVNDFMHQPCCSCGLNWGSVAPKMTKFFFKYHKTCDRVGGDPTWAEYHDMTFCGANCDANWKGKVCWQREFVKRGTRKLHKKTQDCSQVLESCQLFVVERLLSLSFEIFESTCPFRSCEDNCGKFDPDDVA